MYNRFKPIKNTDDVFTVDNLVDVKDGQGKILMQTGFNLANDGGTVGIPSEIQCPKLQIIYNENFFKRLPFKIKSLL